MKELFALRRRSKFAVPPSLRESFDPPIQPAIPEVLAWRLIDGIDHFTSILLMHDRQSIEAARPLLPLIAALAFALLLVSPASLRAQATDGHLIGTVFDQVGGLIAGAAVTVENESSGVTWDVATDDHGAYRFNNLPVGDYRLTAASEGFETASLTHIAVALNRTSTANVTLQVGEVETAVTVTAASAQIDTTTTTIGNAFNARQSLYSPSTNLALGVLNLSLQGAGVASSGGTGLGQGPSVGGQRPRNNSFMVEGVDNNAKDVTGSIVQVPNEAVAEFSSLQNQYGAEFGRSTGGQFNTVVKSGTNELHGSLYEYFMNRRLNALDQSNKRRGIFTRPRLDDNRVGGTVGGPVIRNRLFYFASYQFQAVGTEAAPGRPFSAPTAEGYAALDRIPGLSARNLEVLKRYVQPAPAQTSSTTVQGVDVPVGVLPVNVPAFQNDRAWIISIDSSKKNGDQVRYRYIDNSSRAINPSAAPDLPVFVTETSSAQQLTTVSYFRSLSARWFNESRFGFSRATSDVPSGNFEFPGLDSFPNITIEQDLDIQIGPYDDSPQSGDQSTYQGVSNFSFLSGAHTVKFGADFRRNTSADFYIQRQRGDYNYATLERYLLDLNPDIQAERNTGGSVYHGNNFEFYGYVTDAIKLRRNLTLDIGARYEFKSVPEGDKLQRLNAISSVPGVLAFGEPKSQKSNFAPRLGLAYSPGGAAKTVYRAGFGIAYDSYFTNLGQLTKPPQLENTFRVAPAARIPNFLANGGIRPDQRPEEFDEATARRTTSTYIFDQHLPYSIQWNFGIEHVVGHDYAVNVRYLGTRGVRLFTQSILPVVARANPQRSLPTYLERPAQAELDSLALTLDEIDNSPATLRHFADAGFGPIVYGFPNRGNSIYHGLAAEIKRRFANGLQFIGSYTWSKNIDDSTADIFSTLLSPRRPQDFQDMRAERARSFLDRTHRITVAWVFEVPWYSRSSNWFLRNMVGGWVISGMYTAESPQWATVQSGLDSNRNLDGATDRVVVNPNGVDRVGSDVTPLTNSEGRVVGYVADNPSARYIKAGGGVHPDAGRNTLPLRGINNFDLSVSKRVAIDESKAVEFRASFYNALNHPQYIPGSISSVRAVSSRDTRSNLIPGHPSFDRPDLIYSSHARETQLVLRFEF